VSSTLLDIIIHRPQTTSVVHLPPPQLYFYISITVLSRTMILLEVRKLLVLVVLLRALTPQSHSVIIHDVLTDRFEKYVQVMRCAVRCLFAQLG
jgi:hypothetical protein